MAEEHRLSKPKINALKKKGDRFFQRGTKGLNEAKLGQARIHLDQALLFYSNANDSGGIAACLLKLGRVVELMGEYPRAKETYQASLDLYQRLKDISGIARSKAFLGNVAWAQGDYAASEKLLNEAGHFFKESPDPSGEAWVIDMKANLQLAQGHDMEAEKLHLAALERVLALGEKQENLGWHEYHMAAIQLFRNQLEESRLGFLRALEIFTRLGDVLGKVATCTHLGEIACLQNDFTAAEKYVFQSIHWVIPTQCRPLLTDALTSLARLLNARNQKNKALGILMFVLSHPTCRQQTKDSMVNLSKSLEANFSLKELESGFTWAKQFTMEEMASAWLKVLAPNSKSKKNQA